MLINNSNARADTTTLAIAAIWVTVKLMIYNNIAFGAGVAAVNSTANVSVTACVTGFELLPA